MASPLEVKLAGQRVAAALDKSAPTLDEGSIEQRLEAIRALRAERLRTRRRNRTAGLAAGLACAAAVAFFALRTPSLTFEVRGGRGEVGNWVAAPADAPSTLAFSDGSELELHPSGRARVSSLGKRGATVLLEDGTVTARVVHRDDTDWRITAGPFEVHVVGTTFDAAWSSQDETLSISLAEGRVEVTGSCLGAPVPVSTGENVRLSCRNVVVANLPEPRASASTAASVAMPGPSPSQVPSVADTNTPSVNAVGWRELAKKGQYKQAVELLEQNGVEAIFQMPAGQLLEVADLARLAGRNDLSRKLYLKLHESHAGSDAAAVAAFQLGRTGGDAESWLRLYLTERPNGALAAEALGRILEIEQAAGRPSARATAEQYLNRFPKGAHAAFARKIANP
jgi:hypothetical protein